MVSHEFHCALHKSWGVGLYIREGDKGGGVRGTKGGMQIKMLLLFLINDQGSNFLFDPHAGAGGMNRSKLNIHNFFLQNTRQVHLDKHLFHIN